MSIFEKHIAEEKLLDLGEDLIAGSEAASIERHLHSCKECTRNMAELTHIVNLMRTDDSKAAPEESVQWVKNLYKTRVVEPKRSIFERIVGVLALDVSPDQPVFGERSAVGSTRQMYYKAGETSVVLRVSRDDGGFLLMGQIVGSDEHSESEVEITGPQFSTSEKANELSEFRVGKIPAGVYKLFVRNDKKEIVIENIEIN